MPAFTVLTLSAFCWLFYVLYSGPQHAHNACNMHCQHHIANMSVFHPVWVA